MMPWSSVVHGIAHLTLQLNEGPQTVQTGSTTHVAMKEFCRMISEEPMRVIEEIARSSGAQYAEAATDDE